MAGGTRLLDKDIPPGFSKGWVESYIGPGQQGIVLTLQQMQDPTTNYRIRFIREGSSDSWWDWEILLILKSGPNGVSKLGLTGGVGGALAAWARKWVEDNPDRLQVLGFRRRPA